MHDADHILVLALKNATGFAEGIDRLDQIDATLLMAIVGSILSERNNASDSTDLSQQQADMTIAQKYKTCQKLADDLRNSGYQHKIGFNSFFYPSLNDKRQMLEFVTSLNSTDSRSATQSVSQSPATDRRTTIDDLYAQVYDKQSSYNKERQTFEELLSRANQESGDIPESPISIEAPTVVEMESAIRDAEKRLELLKVDWADYSAPFAKELSRLQTLHEPIHLAKPKTNGDARAEKMRLLLPRIEADIKEKQARHLELLHRYEQLLASKSDNDTAVPKRQDYTDKIFDLLNNIHSQQDVVDKVEADLQSIVMMVERLQLDVERRYETTEILLSGKSSFQQDCLSHLSKIKASLAQLRATLVDIGKMQHKRRESEETLAECKEQKLEARYKEMMRDLNTIREDNRRMAV